MGNSHERLPEIFRNHMRFPRSVSRRVQS